MPLNKKKKNKKKHNNKHIVTIPKTYWNIRRNRQTRYFFFYQTTDITTTSLNNDKVHSSITSSREPFHDYCLLFKQIAWFNDNPYLYMLLRYTGWLLLKQTYHLLAYELWKEGHCSCKMGFSTYVKQIYIVCQHPTNNT